MDQDELYIYLDLAREADLYGDVKTADILDKLIREAQGKRKQGISNQQKGKNPNRKPQPTFNPMPGAKTTTPSTSADEFAGEFGTPAPSTALVRRQPDKLALPETPGPLAVRPTAELATTPTKRQNINDNIIDAEVVDVRPMLAPKAAPELNAYLNNIGIDVNNITNISMTNKNNFKFIDKSGNITQINKRELSPEANAQAIAIANASAQSSSKATGGKAKATGGAGGSGGDASMKDMKLKGGDSSVQGSGNSTNNITLQTGMSAQDAAFVQKQTLEVERLARKNKNLRKRVKELEEAGRTNEAQAVEQQVRQQEAQIAQRIEEASENLPPTVTPQQRRNYKDMLKKIGIGALVIGGAVGVGYLTRGKDVDKPEETPIAPVAPTGTDFQIDTQPTSERSRTRTPSVPDSTLLSWMKAKKAKTFNGVPVFKPSTTLKELYGWAYAEKGENFANSLNAYVRRNFGISGPTAQFGNTNYGLI